MAKVHLRYLCRDTDRHGKVRLYIRRKGKPKLRLLVDENSPHFAQAYAEGLKGNQWRPPIQAAAGRPANMTTEVIPGSFRALCRDYFAAGEYLSLGPITRSRRRAVLEQCCREPLSPGSERLMGDCPMKSFNSVHVRALRDRLAQAPGTANWRLKALRPLFTWATQTGRVSVNPTAGISTLNYASEGYPTWRPEDIRQFEARHPVGTKGRLAMALLFYTGQRRSDIVKLGRQHIRDGELHFVQAKNANRRPVRLVIPILPQLADVLAASPCGDLTFLVTEFGAPFSVAGFGNWFRDRCDEAGLGGLSAHGLRKALQTIGAELGLTDRELMAIAGHSHAAETTRYTRAAEQATLARSAMGKLASGLSQNKSVPPFSETPKSGTKREEKRE